MDTILQPIAEKVRASERLSREDGLSLLEHLDVWTVCQLANEVRHRLHGRVTYYNINRHINYSNICALSCKFCAFHRKQGDEGAYAFSVEEIAAEARKAAEAGATEIHMVGGLHPYLPFSYYTDVLRAIKQAAPQIHVKAFTAVEIVHLSRIAKRPKDLVGVLNDLREAGLGSLPGGGAEVFDDRVHDEAFKGKIRSDQWLEVHRAAHEVGLMSNATILYGHVETLADRVHHLCLLREAQDEAIERGYAGRFQTVIPLPFIPDDSELEHLAGPTGLEDLRMLAVARLMLDNIEHIKCFWIMQTLELAQVTLDSGVNDVDGTVVWYDITRVGGSGLHQERSVRDLRDAIIEAGYEPVERDTVYRPVQRDGASWSVALETAV
ncbi:aminofutalosine synthase MqnE [Mucisphaera calidilacus]|uniref:Aminodeoxyfutalosine synthase n=1 Tax=Mucisphaera calidilacus TaxID=2527982 RepID=A0A518BWC2_9BACT|nr:aminofutalosine synthase MqnE [Mucisphaera calidilacus]QDU71283.1 Aminodeoxyfutalosine synthase [Mucisphaera calidilacus]